MRFTVQDVDGRRVLVGDGTIDANVVPRLQTTLDSGPAVTELWLRSVGGDSRVARDAAMLIRQEGLPTRIPAGAVCANACTFMFMGGIMRFVDPGGIFMIPRGAAVPGDNGATVARAPERAAVAAATALATTEVHQFLTRVGVARSLLTDIMQMPSAAPGLPTPYCLSPDDLARYNVTTRVIVVPAQTGDPGKK